MRHRKTAVRRQIVAGALGLAAALASTTPALAADRRTVTIRGTAVCEAATGGYLVTWKVDNPNDIAGTIGNVRSKPTDRPVEVPRRFPPATTITGTQHLLHDEFTAWLIFDVNWDDNQVDYDYHWPIYIKFRCPRS